MKQVVFEQSAFEDFTNWAIIDKKIYQKIITLIKDIDRNPFNGLGKPEALKHQLVYKVNETSIIVASCKYHYD
ncbi:MAG: type II toxin-antitoxin system YoeB family toxin [Arcobacteraceae bacterium]|nr:type II toxin-antitoxin system YoeB family toxin [Arcobacteraceae bacterium]